MFKRTSRITWGLQERYHRGLPSVTSGEGEVGACALISSQTTVMTRWPHVGSEDRPPPPFYSNDPVYINFVITFKSKLVTLIYVVPLFNFSHDKGWCSFQCEIVPLDVFFYRAIGGLKSIHFVYIYFPIHNLISIPFVRLIRASCLLLRNFVRFRSSFTVNVQVPLPLHGS